MLIRRSLPAVFAAASLAGCVMVPVTYDGWDPYCQVVTHHMELKAVQIAEINHCYAQDCVGAVIVAAGLVAASTVVSGSIVVVGNVAYWAERRSSCLPAPAAAPLATAGPQG